MAIHVAILRAPYIAPILEGRKTIESRITKTATPPWDRIAPGDRLFVKESGGPFRLTCLADRVEQHRDLTPPDIQRLQKTHEPRVLGGEDYWRSKLGHRFAVFIHLRDIEPTDAGPVYRKAYMRAWYVLDDDAVIPGDATDDDAGPTFDAELTGGAIRNRYVIVPRVALGMQADTFTLELPGGERVRTSLVDGRRIKWRGWGPYFRRYGLLPGSRVRFVALESGGYRVRFLP